MAHALEELPIFTLAVKYMQERGEWRRESGWIYFLEGDGCWKIGRSKDPLSRAAMLSIATPFKTTLRFAYPDLDTIKVEKSVHSIFANRRLNGEWFALSEDDIYELEKFIQDQAERWSNILKDWTPKPPQLSIFRSRAALSAMADIGEAVTAFLETQDDKDFTVEYFWKGEEYSMVVKVPVRKVESE